MATTGSLPDKKNMHDRMKLQKIYSPDISTYGRDAAKERRKPGAAHAVCSKSLGIWQFAFFEPGKISARGISVSSCDTAQIMLRDAGDRWILSAGNPAPDGRKRTLKFRTDAPLAPGTYRYMTAGLYPLEGETVSVSPCEGGREITVDLPDSEDAARYGYSSDLYSASPIVIQIPKTPLPKL